MWNQNNHAIVIWRLLGKGGEFYALKDLIDSLSKPKGEMHAGQRQIMGTKTCIGIRTALSVMLREAWCCTRLLQDRHM